MLQGLVTPERLDTLITTRQLRPLIVVAPDGRSGAPVPTQWTDSSVGHFPVESAFIDEVIPYVDTHYRAIAAPDGRVLAGLSMGGYGATNLALKHPDLFGGVIAMGAYFTPEWATARTTPWYLANDPSLKLAQAASAPAVRFYLAAAMQDKPYVDDTIAFAARLGQLNAHYILQTWSGGHAWNVWEAQIVAGMRWYFAGPSQHTCPVCRQGGPAAGA
jgi:enterochelin esterase-like enzyme